MDIGTAKVDLNSCCVPHHMIDIILPDEEFSVGKYMEQAGRIIKKILKKGKVPLAVGGTGLYIKALTDGLCWSPPQDNALRKKLYNEAQKHSSNYLYTRLKKIDTASALKMHEHNIKRIVRALEVYELTGIPLSQIQNQSTYKPFYKVILIGLLWDRKALYERINRRVDKLIELGLVEEVRHLLDIGYSEDLNAMQALGYKQTIGFLKGRYDFREAVRLIKRDTRRYAKRQMTWFKKEHRIHWIDINDELDVSQVIRSIKDIFSEHS